MTEPTAPQNRSEKASKEGSGRLLRTAGSLAQHLTRVVGGLALSSALAGTVLWGLLWWPVPLHPGSLVGAGFTLIVLLGPAAVLGLFYAGLRDLAALPDRLFTHASRTVEASTAAYHVATDASDHWFGRLHRLLRRLWSLRSLFAEHRALLVRYGAMLRVLTPGFLAFALLAGGLAVLLIALTAGLGLIALLLG